MLINVKGVEECDAREAKFYSLLDSKIKINIIACIPAY